MSCLQTIERAVGPVFIRPVFLPKAGDSVRGHQHNFGHATLLCSGSVRVRETHPDGSTAEHEHGKKLDAWETRAEVCHEITALSDDTVFGCIFTHRDPASGEVVQEANQNWAAYR